VALEESVRRVDSLESLFGLLSSDELAWPVDPSAMQDDGTFAWSANELRLDESAARHISHGSVQQLRPFPGVRSQPWGIFLVTFTDGRIYRTALRQVLRGLVPSRRRESHLPEWHHENLLFICTTREYDRFTFAHFRGEQRQKARLATFEWERGAPYIHTLCKFNLPALRFPKDGGADIQGWISQWQSAFDKSRVTEQFYKDYVEVLDRIEESIVGLEDTEKEPHARRDYAQLVLGRLMFLYFLQKKGWLGIAGQTTASGARLQPDDSYLERHFERITGSAKAGGKSTAFYDDFLIGLFFNVLNTPRNERPAHVTRTYGEIPFLNGGLFQRTKAELYHRARLHIPNDVFRLLFDPRDGLFLRYNFTVKEDEPLDITVAVDPEMLGLVFERQVVQREVKGAFYTPPSVVGFMCQRSLAEYLSEETALPRGKVTDLLEFDDAGDLTADETSAVFDRLADITVCDAAVGSGAFLLGVLHRLVRVHYVLYETSPSVATLMRTRLAEVNHRLSRLTADATESQVKYQLKRAIIQKSLFGVDIEPSAIQIAQLRMWLSLCVEHEAEFVQDIPPLPNLDYNLRVGNSLTGHYLGIDFELETDTRSQRFRPILDELDRFEAQYYEMTDEQEKDNQRREIENLHWRLLEEGVRAELRQLPARRRAIEKALERRRTESLFPEMENHTPQERAHLAWLDSREVDLNAGLERLTTDQRHLREEEQSHHPVLWRVHFARVFREKGGFDVVIMNPPYVSTQGTSGLDYISNVTGKLGFNDDLYVFFAFRAFGLPHFLGIARPGGVVCYITSDTFFTLQTKTRIRELLQSRDLRLLVQCDPFRQTVDTAVFLALNRTPEPEQDSFEFIQARAVLDRFPHIAFSPPWAEGATFALPVTEAAHAEETDGDIEDEVPDDEPVATEAETGPVPGIVVPTRECEHDRLRRYQVPAAVYRGALKNAFFEPSRRNAALYSRFMEPLKRLVDEWWDRIKDSRRFEQNQEAIVQYHQTLCPGQVTIVGLVCEGGQGMRTANNGRFLGYLEGTPQAERVLERRRALAAKWETDKRVAPVYRRLKAKKLNFPELADALKAHFAGEQNWTRVLGLKRGEIYRIVPRDLIFDVKRMTEEQREKVIHSGIKGKRRWVPYRKGDPKGNKWVSFDPLFIEWSKKNVAWLSDRCNPVPRWQGYNFFFTEGITWTLFANHAPLKARLQPKCVFDASGSRLTPTLGMLSAHFVLAVLNSDVVSYFSKRFIKNTQDFEIGDLRLLPVVMPTPPQHKRLEQLARRAVAVQTDILRDGRTKQQPELDRIQGEVNAAVEELYGVSGLGPFDEF